MDLYDKRRVAVLPFVNISPDPSDEYLADGLTEELITVLSQISGLQVIARTTMMQYKGTNKKISTIGSELMVGTVFEGSVRKVLNKIRVTVQLIDVASEAHLWSKIYEKELGDLFAIQSDVSSNVAESLTVSLSQFEREILPERGTTDLIAYTQFLKGREILRTWTTETTVKEAIDLFESVIRREPNFARAYLGVAECHLRLGDSGDTPQMESVEVAKKFLEKALLIDDKLAEAHSLLSIVMFEEDHDDLAESEAKKAIELNPSLPDAYLRLSTIKIIRGDITGALKLAETAYRLDPLEKTVVARLGFLYFCAGQEKEALMHWSKTLGINPHPTYCVMAMYYLYKGEKQKAEETISKLQKMNIARDFFTLMLSGYLAATLGQRVKALDIIAMLKKESYEGNINLNYVGYIYYALGDYDAFFDCMFRSAKAHTFPGTVLRSPLFAKIKDDPRFDEMYKKSDQAGASTAIPLKKGRQRLIHYNDLQSGEFVSKIDEGLVIGELSFTFASEKTKLLFNYLVNSFISDYMARKYVSEKSGWRGLVQAANELKVSASIFYGKEGGFSPIVNELIRKGFAEARVFPGERGRGGEVTRFRIAYEREPISEYVKMKIRSAR
jgi:adenylate cyclase